MPQLAITLAVTAGSMALQYLLAPKVKQQPVDAGKMDDVRVQGSDYGAYIPRWWGVGRGAGNVVWSNGVQHYVIDTPGSGGKGGGGGAATPATRTHVYKTSMGVLIQRGPISQFLKIWADADLIQNNTPTTNGVFQAESATKTGGAANYTDSTASGGAAVHLGTGGGSVTFNISGVPTPTGLKGASSPDPGDDKDPYTRVSVVYKCLGDRAAYFSTNTDLHQVVFPASAEWTVYSDEFFGFANTAQVSNNSGAALDIDYIYVERYWKPVDFKAGGTFFRVSGVVNENIAYPPNLDDPGEYYNYPVAKNPSTGTYSLTSAIPDQQLRFYTGTETQTADAAIIAWLDQRYGSGQGSLYASPMRGLVYVVFQDFTLRQSRVPNFTFETDTGDATVNTILTAFFSDVGLSATDYDISATASLTQQGFFEGQNSSRKSLIEFLERYHGFRIGEIDGKIKTIPDTFSVTATLADTSLRAHGDGEEMPRSDIEVLIKDPKDLPREVRVNFMNKDLEYHNDVVNAPLFTDIVGKETSEFSFPIVDDPSNARLAAEKLILKAYAEGQAYDLTGMPELAKYSIGDVIRVPINGVLQPLRIEKKQMTLPIGKVRIQGVSVNPFTPAHYVDSVTSAAVKAVSQYALDSFPRNSVVFVIQSLPIFEKDKGRLGVYLAISGRGRGDGENCALYREMASENFVLQSVIDASSPLGLTTSALATVSDTTVEDTTHSLDLYFFDDISLETVLQADLDRNPTVNLIRVGNEWIQFRTATALSLEDNSPYRSKWRISNLWRGRFGTASAVAGHASGEYAAVVTQALRFYDLETIDIGKTVTLKAVTSGQNQELAPETSFTFAPVSTYSMSNVTADRSFDANNTSVNELADVVGTLIGDLHR